MNPINPSVAPVQAPTRTAVLMRRPMGTGSTGSSGSGSYAATGSRISGGARLRSQRRGARSRRPARPQARGRSRQPARALPGGQPTAVAVPPPAHALSTSSTLIPLAVARAAADSLRPGPRGRSTRQRRRSAALTQSGELDCGRRLASRRCSLRSATPRSRSGTWARSASPCTVCSPRSGSSPEPGSPAGRWARVVSTPSSINRR